MSRFSLYIEIVNDSARTVVLRQVLRHEYEAGLFGIDPHMALLRPEQLYNMDRWGERIRYWEQLGYFAPGDGLTVWRH